MLEINASKRYEKKLAFEGQVNIQSGECVGIVGNNGAGKTTMLRLITDLIKATEGEIRSKGKLVNESEDWKKYTGTFIDDGFLIPFLSPIEYLDLVAKLSAIPTEKLKSFLDENSGFYEESLLSSKHRIEALSKGNKNKVGILAALLIQPEVLILDEPFANLDPKSRSWLVKKLKSENEKGMTMLISSHDLHQITEISTRTLLLDKGRITLDQETNEETLRVLENHFQIEEY